LSNPRIIAGLARGIRLKMVPGDITRPITDRVKESLFNIIGVDIQNASFLDLFGGTGSVGIEALSRGASFSRLLDISPAAVKTINENLEKTKLSARADVVCMDAFAYLKSRSNQKFDYVYIAPPQYKKMWLAALDHLNNNTDHLNSDAWVIVQIDPVENTPFNYKNLELIDHREYGSTLLLFLINTH
jgi:16S rRNA (guanine966-N2)-methyltransferase